MKDMVFGIVVFVLLGWLVGGQTGINVWSSNARALIEACEASLPRDQKCVLKAEPEGVKGHGG